MSSTTLTRLSGISLLLGSLLLLPGSLLAVFAGFDFTNPLFTMGAIIRMLGTMFLTLGLPGMYARLAGQSGMLGFIGFTCLFLFFLCWVTDETILAFIAPLMITSGLDLALSPSLLGIFAWLIIATLLGLIGGLLLGITILRTPVLPRLAGLLLLVGMLTLTIGSAINGPTTPFNLGRSAGFFLVAVSFIWLAAGMLSYQQIGAKLRGKHTDGDDGLSRLSSPV